MNRFKSKDFIYILYMYFISNFIYSMKLCCTLLSAQTYMCVDTMFTVKENHLLFLLYCNLVKCFFKLASAAPDCPCKDVWGVTSSACWQRESDQRRTRRRAASWPATTVRPTGPPPPAGLLCWTPSLRQDRGWSRPAGGSSPPSPSYTPDRQRSGKRSKETFYFLLHYIYLIL